MNESEMSLKLNFASCPHISSIFSSRNPESKFHLEEPGIGTPQLGIQYQDCLGVDYLTWVRIYKRASKGIREQMPMQVILDQTERNQKLSKVMLSWGHYLHCLKFKTLPIHYYHTIYHSF